MHLTDVVTVRDLRNHGGEVLGRVERGERFVVTRDGAAVAELNPLPSRSVSPAELIRRRRNLPRVQCAISEVAQPRLSHAAWMRS